MIQPLLECFIIGIAAGIVTAMTALAGKYVLRMLLNITMGERR